jgi:hypothetical protein
MQQGIRFHFSPEQDYKFGFNYFRFNKVEYRTYQTSENKAQTVLLRGLPPKVTAETVLSEIRHIDYPAILVKARPHYSCSCVRSLLLPENEDLELTKWTPKPVCIQSLRISSQQISAPDPDFPAAVSFCRTSTSNVDAP